MIKKINLDKTFLIALIISGIIYALPSKMLIGVYSPSYIGWFLIVFLIPIVLILFIWLSILDLKQVRINKLVMRFFTLIIVFGISISIKYFFK
ncbi:hypothetical protein [Aquimarina litoralis]|uniref:hypothetical protein n=1 Tax=Aquimarina litoralis TaxID=584605 RepID=UPI001C571811|nr:hypothetical protein [Aquimarina litoralis]MBW1299037.1 hypothetical protein [Aquimarina litoralis]